MNVQKSTVSFPFFSDRLGLALIIRFGANNCVRKTRNCKLTQLPFVRSSRKYKGLFPKYYYKFINIISTDSDE